MLLLLIAFAAVLLLLVLVPNRIRAFLNQVFALIVTPARDTAMLTLRYLSGFPRWSANIMSAGGIAPPHLFSKMIDTIIQQ